MRRRSASLMAGALVAGLVLSRGPALADGWRVAMPLDGPAGLAPSGSAYLEPEAGYRVQSLPRFDLGRVGATNFAPFYTTSPQPGGVQGGLTLGHLLPPDWAPPGLGKNFRVELSGTYYRLSDNSAVNFGPGGTPGFWVFVGGGQSLNTGGIVSADTHTELNGYELALRVASDVPLTPALTLTPAVALFAGESRTTFDYHDDEIAPGLFQETLNERIHQRDIGLAVSLGSRYSLAHGLSLLFGGAVAADHYRARLDASDCFDGSTVLPGCQPAPGSSLQTTLDRTTFRIAGQGGLRYDLGFARLDLLGNIRYAGSAASVRNPTRDFEAASLVGRDQLGYGATLRLIVPLGAPPTASP